MEGDELSEFLVPKKENITELTEGIKEDTGGKTKGDFNLKREPLTTKNAMKLLLEGTLKSKVCRYCLNVDSSLYEMDQVFQIGSQNSLFKVSIRDMVASFYPFQVIEDPNYPTKICEKCLDNSFQSYLFTQQCERAGRALLNCFEDMYEKLDKLDPLERTKKRGRQKINPNYNTLYTEHEKVIDYADPIINIVNKGSDITDKKNDTINDLECPKCWQVHTTLESLINHEKIHPKTMWFSCRLCGKSFAKRHLYRKHVKNTHNNTKEVALPEIGFKCLECDVGNETYDKHLQHIEKHKFQMVMEHLVERKMDKLCTVCLTKESNMVKLDRTISLHGGCPELTGHRSLYNILGSTLPEQASYKYQELLVPHEANILTLSKKLHLKLFGEQISIPAIKDGEYHYSLSDPIIISREILKTDEDYLFIFNKPNHYGQIININENFDVALHIKNDVRDQNVISMQFISQVPYESAIKNVEVQANSLVKTSEPNIFNFSYPDYIIDVEKITSNNKISDTLNSNIDWVFEKCNDSYDVDQEDAKKCNESKDIVIQEDATNDCNESRVGVKDCNYCWIFKNADKCYNCQKPNNKDAKCPSNGTDIETNTSVQNDEVQSNKRKNVELNDSGNKRSKWQCKFCLTHNGDNEKCHCCDTEYNIKDLDPHIKFNLGINKSFFEIDDFSKKFMPMETNDTKLVITKSKDKAIDNIASQISNERRDESLQQNIGINQNIGNKHSNTEKHATVFHLKEDEIMDTELKEITNPKICYNDINVVQEEMDVEECNIIYNVHTPPSREMDCIDNQVYATQFPHSSMNFTNIPLNFNIGAGTSDKKKCRPLKRAIRRMATSFHK